MYATIATERQINFILRLVAERAWRDSQQHLFVSRVSEIVTDLNMGGHDLDKRSASSVIDWLMAQPVTRKQPVALDGPARKPVAEVGMYRLGDDIYKVQKAVHGSGNLYAKKLNVGVASGAEGNEPATYYVSFDYAPGAIKHLSSEDLMSLEEAKQFGVLYGTCCVCGRTLTREESIEAGIGPVCSGKGYWRG